MSAFTGSITDVVLKQLWLITKSSTLHFVQTSLMFPFNVWITESSTDQKMLVQKLT